MSEEQFKKFMEMQFAQLVLIHGIFNCLQASNVNQNPAGRNVGTMHFGDAKKILDSAAATLKQA